MAPTGRDVWIAEETLRRADHAAQRAGVDRRRFLQSAGGLAVMLGVVNACSNEKTATGPSKAGGSFTTPTEPSDLVECESALGSQGELIVDVHTHHVMPAGPWRQNAPGIEEMILRLVPDGCEAPDPLECLDRAHYVQDLFLGSDTTVAMLSDVPNSGPADAPVPFDENLASAEFAASVGTGGAPRVLTQSVVAPNFGELPPYLDLMSAQATTGKVASFKAYTAWGPDRRGYALDDPAIGLPVIEQARSLGVTVFCAHKGLPLMEFDLSHNGPDDLVSAAKQFPDVQFVVYHSAFERETTEGPYDPASASRGTNSLVAALDRHGIPPNANVWCELGTTWREVMTNPTEAAHVMGKLLSRVGEDRVLWGTDAIWYGSPQPQIAAFRVFEISAEFQERFGYPALTAERKQKVFGLNAAALLGLDPQAYCALGGDPLAVAQASYDEIVRDGVVDPWVARGPLSRRDVLTWARRVAWTPW